MLKCNLKFKLHFYVTGGKTMKIAILGAGAMGSLYATYLSSIHEVTLLDSYKPQVDAINTNGLTKVEKDNTESNYTIKASISGTDIGIQDLLIVFVKSINTFDAVKENQAIIGPKTIVMTLQNGAGNNHDIANFVKKEHIIVGTSSHNSVSLGLGKFFHSGCGPTNIGPDFPCDESQKAVKIIAQAMCQCNLDVNIISNIQKVLWGKLFVNCGVNALSAIMECNLGKIHSNPYLWEICTKVVHECVLVAKADGTCFNQAEALETVQHVCISDAVGYASMYQDRQHKRRTEIDKINGVVANLGQTYCIDTPYNEMLVDQIHALEQSYLLS